MASGVGKTKAASALIVSLNVERLVGAPFAKVCWQQNERIWRLVAWNQREGGLQGIRSPSRVSS